VKRMIESEVLSWNDSSFFLVKGEFNSCCIATANLY